MPLVSIGRGGDSREDVACEDEPIAVLKELIRDALLNGNTSSDAETASDELSDCSSPLSEGPLETPEDSNSCLPPESDDFVDMRIKLLTADIIGQDVHLEASEKRLIYSEIHGRQAPEIEIMEGRLHELENEIWQLPQEKKAALLRVLRKNPLLFIVSSHTKLFLFAEDFDAKRAAQRLANYWTRREQLFGEDGAFMEGDVPDAGLHDYIRFYKRCELVADNPDADEVVREIAKDYIRCVNKAKVSLLDKCVLDALKNRKDILFWLEECKLLRNTNSAYPEIVGTIDHKMLFVRCEDFMEENAAGRMMKYWSRKCDLFGPNLASRNIDLDDMEDCLRVLNLGFIRIMPGSDKYGRVVVVFTMKILAEALADLSDEEGERAITKTIWYVLNAATEQKNCQRNGLVFLANLRNGNTDILRRFKLRAACRDILMRCIPVKVKAFHFFFPPSQSWWQSAIYSLFKHAEPLYKKHAVIHATASEELELSELAECGIFPSGLPTELGGNVSFSSYKEWLEERRLKQL